jgi:hypothetical protein
LIYLAIYLLGIAAALLPGTGSPPVPPDIGALPIRDDALVVAPTERLRAQMPSVRSVLD